MLILQQMPKSFHSPSNFIFVKNLRCLTNRKKIVCPTLCSSFFSKAANSSLLRKCMQYRFNSPTLQRNLCTKSDGVNHAENLKKSSFMQSMHIRKKQALCSVLMEVINKNNIPQATEALSSIGNIKHIFSYAGVSDNVFLLVEYDNEECVQNLLQCCSFKNIFDKFTAITRIIQYDPKSKKHTNLKLENSIIYEDNGVINSKEKTVSEMIENLYDYEKLTELDTRLRFFLCAHLKDSISGLFPFSDILPFGSSVNGLGRRKCDLDIMLRLYPDKEVCKGSEFYFFNKTCVGDVRALQQKCILSLGDYFRTFLPGISSALKILHARVPILKFNHSILKMECDLSVNNMSAILMSEMLYFCGDIDSRVRPLIYAVKKWAKEAKITYSAPGSWITNFGLSLLVIFFLQNRPMPILPALNDAVVIKGAETYSEFKLDYLVPTSELQVKASENKETLAMLLKEFLTFLAEYNFKESHLSILSGSSTKKLHGDSIWMQYPLEEDKNVTKNVSDLELSELSWKAEFSSKSLESRLNFKGTSTKDLMVLLGIPSIQKENSHNSKKLDLSALMKSSRKVLDKSTNKKQAVQ